MIVLVPFKYNSSQIITIIFIAILVYVLSNDAPKVYDHFEEGFVIKARGGGPGCFLHVWLI